MSETQLRAAFTLMKQGDKQGAAKLIQAVLKEDRSNIQAWWLFSHVLDDEEKVVKSLEKVLALNPEHAGARKRLAQLRPEYAHLVQDGRPEKIKSKNTDSQNAYWDKLNRTQKSGVGVSLNFAAPIIQTFGWRLGGRIIILIVIAFIALVMNISNFVVDLFAPDNPQVALENNTILMSMDNTPESVAKAYFEAFFREDTTALRAITCAQDQAVLSEKMADFGDLEPEDVSVDFSQTSFTLDESDVTWAYISIHGTTVIAERGNRFTINWEELASYEGYEFYGLYLEKIDDTWLVCGEG